MDQPITHAQIYERLLTLEAKVDNIETHTKDLVEVVTAAKGAIKVLDWIANLAKPVLWISAAFGAVTLFWSQFKK
jgi:hypothetical protein